MYSGELSSHLAAYETMRGRSGGSLGEIDLVEGKRRHARVAEERDVHLAALDVALDEHRLVVLLEERADATHERPLVVDDVVVPDADRGVLVRELDEERVRQIDAGRVLDALDDAGRRGRHAARAQDVLGLGLVQAQAERRARPSR